MLDILGLGFLIRVIVKLTLSKGIAPEKYITTTLVAWLGLEILGFIVGLYCFGTGANTLELLPFGTLGAIIGGAIGYLITRNDVKKIEEYRKKTKGCIVDL